MTMSACPIRLPPNPPPPSSTTITLTASINSVALYSTSSVAMVSGGLTLSVRLALSVIAGVTMVSFVSPICQFQHSEICHSQARLLSSPRQFPFSQLHQVAHALHRSSWYSQSEKRGDISSSGSCFCLLNNWCRYARSVHSWNIFWKRYFAFIWGSYLWSDFQGHSRHSRFLYEWTYLCRHFSLEYVGNTYLSFGITLFQHKLHSSLATSSREGLPVIIIQGLELINSSLISASGCLRISWSTFFNTTDQLALNSPGALPWMTLSAQQH